MTHPHDPLCPASRGEVTVCICPAMGDPVGVSDAIIAELRIHDAVNLMRDITDSTPPPRFISIRTPADPANGDVWLDPITGCLHVWSENSWKIPSVSA